MALAFRILTTLAIVAYVNAQCPVVSTSENLVLDLTTTNNNCFTIPGSNSVNYRAKILNSVYGRHEITTGSSGYAWSNDADGIYYCAAGATTISFTTFPTDSVVTVSAIEMAADTCNSDVVSYNGVVPVATPKSMGTEVYFSSHRYFLKAVHFEYHIAGEDTVTFENAQSIEISGDPGSDEYHSIEVVWSIAGKEKRFYAYISADSSAGTWDVFEIRVYDNQQSWVYFYPNNMKGNLGECFKHESFQINDNSGESQIRFEGLSLATFAPWTNSTDFLQCIDGTLIGCDVDVNIDDSELRDATAESLNINGFQVQLLSTSNPSRDRDLRVAARDQAASSCIAYAASSGELALDLNAKLGTKDDDRKISVALLESTGSADSAVECDHVKSQRSGSSRLESPVYACAMTVLSILGLSTL